MTKLYRVYVHIFPNHKKYVGITSSSTLHRWGDHGQGYANQKLMWRAIQKYGWDNIQHIVIADNLSRKQACALEIQLIALFQSNKPRYGYNVSEGGDIPVPRSKETQKRINEKLRGRKLSDETRQKMSKSRMGELNPFYGKHHSAETWEKIRTARKEKGVSKETRMKLSAVHKGIPKSQEHKDKLSKSLMGHTVSEEARLKMSLAKKGKPSNRIKYKHSEETQKN